MATSTSTVGLVGSSGGNAVVGAVSESKGWQRSALAERIAPPSRKTEETGLALGMGCGTFLLLLFIAVGAGQLWLFFVGIGAAFLVYHLTAKEPRREAAEYNENEWPKKMTAWKRSAMCMQCGEVQEIVSS